MELLEFINKTRYEVAKVLHAVFCEEKQILLACHLEILGGSLVVHVSQAGDHWPKLIASTYTTLPSGSYSTAFSTLGGEKNQIIF